MDFILLLLTRNPERNGNLAFRVLFCLSYGNFFQQNSKNRIRGTDAVFSKGIFMKKFLRKDTYIILMPTPSVNSFQDNLQLFHI